MYVGQGCQMVYFQTKNPNFVENFSVLRLEYVDIFYGHLKYLGIFGIFYDPLVQFVFVWYIFPVLVSFTNKNLATLM
jgi:hypothetical protein